MICKMEATAVEPTVCGCVSSAHQGVEDDDMNVFSLGGQVIGQALARELIETFLKARFSGAERHQRWEEKVRALENLQVGQCI
jgi:ribose 5-phosphate isomerase B